MTSVTSNFDTGLQTKLWVKDIEDILRIICDRMREMATNMQELQELVRAFARINQDLVAKMDLLINNYKFTSKMIQSMMEQADQRYTILKDIYNSLEELDEKECYVMMDEENQISS